MTRPKTANAKLLTSALLAACALLLGGCPQGGEGEADDAGPAGPRTENAGLGMVLTSVPGIFSVASNEDGQIVLARQEKEGTLVIRAGEPQIGGVNLFDAVNAHSDKIQSMEQGQYGGQMELGSHLGTTFYSRGRYSEGGATVEEVVFFMVHPGQDKTLEIEYIYPAGDDSSDRIQGDVFSVLEYLESMESAPAGDESAPAGDDGSSPDAEPVDGA